MMGQETPWFIEHTSLAEACHVGYTSHKHYIMVYVCK